MGLHIDMSALPVSHCGQSTTFSSLNRKARGSRKDGKSAKQAEQQYNVNSAGHTVTDDRKKRKGLFWPMPFG